MRNATYSTFNLGRNEYKRVEIDRGKKVIWFACYPGWREGQGQQRELTRYGDYLEAAFQLGKAHKEQG